MDNIAELRRISGVLDAEHMETESVALSDLAKAWAADQDTIERLLAAASGKGMASEMADGRETALLVIGLHKRAERAEEKLADAINLLREYAALIHENSSTHPSENFRGCTHDDCRRMRVQIKRLELG